MVIVGAFARVGPGSAAAVRGRVEGIPGVETFDLGDPLKLGVLIEADDLDAAHDLLAREVRGTEGVMGVWPVYVHEEADAGEAARDVAEAS